MFRLVIRGLSLGVGLFFLSFFTQVRAVEEPLVLYYGQGCPHCAVVEEYLDENNLWERYQIEAKEIYFDRENAQEFNLALSGLNVTQRGVPALLVGDQVLMGDTPIIEWFENQDTAVAVTAYDGQANDNSELQSDEADLTWIVVMGAAVVDAINPCAFAVLILLLTTVLMSGRSVRILQSGLAFSLAIFISYFLMGLGLYQAIGLAGMTSVVFRIVGVLAIVLGLLNLKDFFWYGKGMLMEVPVSWRPRMKKIIGSVTSPIGAFTTGFVVSLFLLPCTSGPYIVILGMLAENQQRTQAVMYLLFYNLIFILPMILITLLVYFGLDPKRLESVRQKNLRVLHLIAGLVLIAMGLVLIFDLV